MFRKWLLTVAAVALALPAGLSAQETPAPRPRRTPRAESRVFSMAFNNRGRIGVVVNTAANAESDKYGARIDGVTPGGPAEKAGLKAGDIITKFNGTSLGGLVPVDDEDSGPGLKLVDLARDLDPGDTVKVEYRRGSSAKTATLVAQDLGGYTFAMPSVQPPVVEVQPRMERAPLMSLGEGNGFSFCFGDAWCNLELVTLNSDLGDYFGTKDGILVVKAPADSTLPLKGGDVILAIGGRTPTSPSHAMRILRSYEAGETVSIEIMRHQRRTTVSWKVPDQRERGWLRSRVAPDRAEQSLWRVPDGEFGATQRALDASRQTLERALTRARDAFQRQEILRLEPLKRSSTIAL
jgi:hypothetical protein